MYEKMLTRSVAYACLFFALFALPGCRAAAPENPEALQAALVAASTRGGLWQSPVKGIDATLRPDSTAYGGHNFVLNAAYRVIGPDEVRFAVFLPQGNKLGQCSRKGRDVTCSNLSFPGANGLVRSSFAALDEVLALAPAVGDSYELTLGDKNAGVSADVTVLRRRRSGMNGNSVVITGLDGAVLAAYKRARFSGQSGGGAEDMTGRITSWKAVFNTDATGYRFMPQGNNWLIDVAVVRFIE